MSRLRRFKLGLPAAAALAWLLAGLVLVPLLAFAVHTLVRNDITDEFVNNVRAQTREFGLRMADQPDLNAAHDLLQDWLIGGQIEFGEFVPVNGPVIRASLPRKDNYLNFKEDFQFNEHGDHNYFISVPVQGTVNGLRGVLRLGFDERPVLQRLNVLYRQGIVVMLAFIAASVAAGGLFGLALQRDLYDLQLRAHHAATGRSADTPPEIQATLPRIREFEALSEGIAQLARLMRLRERELQRSETHKLLMSGTDRRLFVMRVQAALQGSADAPAPCTVYGVQLGLQGGGAPTDAAEFDEELLQTAVARVLAAGSEPGPAGGFEFIARLGAREFGLLQTGANDAAQAEAQADRILEALNVPMMVAGYLAQLVPAIGIAIAPADGALAEALVRNAEIAMIEAARRGGEQACQYTALRLGEGPET